MLLCPRRWNWAALICLCSAELNVRRGGGTTGTDPAVPVALALSPWMQHSVSVGTPIGALKTPFRGCQFMHWALKQLERWSVEWAQRWLLVG